MGLSFTIAELPYPLKILDKVELYLAQNPIELGKPLRGEYTIFMTYPDLRIQL